MKQAKLLALIPLLLAFLIMAGCVSAGVGVGPFGAGAVVHPFGGSVYVGD